MGTSDEDLFWPIKNSDGVPTGRGRGSGKRNRAQLGQGDRSGRGARASADGAPFGSATATPLSSIERGMSDPALRPST